EPVGSNPVATHSSPAASRPTATRSRTCRRSSKARTVGRVARLYVAVTRVLANASKRPVSASLFTASSIHGGSSEHPGGHRAIGLLHQLLTGRRTLGVLDRLDPGGGRV